MLKKIIPYFLLVLIIFDFGFRIFQYRENYLEKFEPRYWEQRYLNSQWVKAIDSEPIGDDGVYTWAGWQYLRGENPIMINPETPPLGKYLLGVTIKLINNRNLFAVWTGILSLISLFLLAKKTLKNLTLSLVVVFLFSLEPLFYQQLRAPFLDTLYLSFFNLFLFFAFENWWLSFLFLGAAASTKATLVTLGLGLTTIFLTLVFLQDKKNLRRVVFSLPISILVLLLSYFRYFASGYNLVDFLRLQKWVFVFYQQGVVAQKGMIFPLIFLNRWQSWWNGIIMVEEWRISWPIITLALSLFWLKLFKTRKRDNPHQLLLGIYSLLYLSFLSFVPVWPRYLLLFLPFGLILLVGLVKKNLFAKIKLK